MGIAESIKKQNKSLKEAAEPKEQTFEERIKEKMSKLGNAMGGLSNKQDRDRANAFLESIKDKEPKNEQSDAARVPEAKVIKVPKAEKVKTETAPPVKKVKDRSTKLETIKDRESSKGE